MKYLLPLLALVLALPSFSQDFFSWRYNDRYYSVQVGAGLTGYFGELNHDNSIRQQFSHVSLGAEARLLSRLGARLELIQFTLVGNDRDAPDSSFNRQRNLDFSSKNYEANLQAIYYFRKYRGNYHKRWTVDPYVGLGIAATTFSPRTDFIDSTGVRSIKLRDVQTEGVAYSKLALGLPATVGVKLRINEFINVNAEVSYRYTFSDYLDDVSDSFIEDDGSLASQLSNRRSQVRNDDGEFFIVNQEFFDAMVPGAPRGNPNRNDSYLFISFKVEVFIPTSKSSPLLSKPSAFSKGKNKKR